MVNSTLAMVKGIIRMEPVNSNYFNYDNDFLSGAAFFPIEQWTYGILYSTPTVAAFKERLIGNS